MKISSLLVSAIIILNLVSCGKQINTENTLYTATVGSIVGGSPAKTSEYRSVVGLVNKNGRIICTGNLINNKQITTAAHCILSHQMNQAQKKFEKLKIIAKISNKITQNINVGHFTKEDIENPLINAPILRILIKETISEVLQTKAKALNIHIGIGSTNPSEKVQILKVKIIRANITNKYETMIFNSFFKGSPYSNPLEDYIQETITPDQVILTLDSEVKGATTVPTISEEEARTILKSEKPYVTLVGFGAKTDPRGARDLKSLIVFLTSNLGKNILTDEQEKQVRENLLLLEKQLRNDETKLQQQGNKNITNLKVIRFDNFIIASNYKAQNKQKQRNSLQGAGEARKKLSKKEQQELIKQQILEYAANNKMDVTNSKMLTGACFGDSGGPAFTKLPSGELRQLGIIVAVDYCGQNTMITPIQF